jgi:hypothetical protein
MKLTLLAIGAFVLQAFAAPAEEMESTLEKRAPACQRPYQPPPCWESCRGGSAYLDCSASYVSL